MRALPLFVTFIAVGATSFAAVAQDKPAKPDKPAEKPKQPEGQPREGGPGRREGQQRDALTPEKAKAAWELEAAGVAKRLGLDADKSKALAKAYAEARESHSAASEKLRKELQEKREKEGNGNGDGEGRRGMAQESLQAMDDMNKKEREKFEKALGSTLSADQTKKVMGSLGTFNPQWDRMADAIAGFNLEPAKQQSALDAVETFVGESVKARADNPGDREAMMAAMQDAREKLNDNLKKTLSEEQLKKFQESTRGGFGRGPGGGGGRGPGGGGGGGGG